MSQNEDLVELEALKQQFGLINEKLEKQSLINEKMVSETIRIKIGRMERWYRNRFSIYALAPVPVATFINMGFHWGFTALFVAISVAQFLLDLKCYRILNPKKLASLSMTQASENVTKHRYWRTLADKVIIVPLPILAVWTVLTASGYTMNIPIITVTAAMILGGVIWGVKLQKENMKKLDEAMEAIRDLKG